MDNTVVGQILNILELFEHSPRMLQNDKKGMTKTVYNIQQIY